MVSQTIRLALLFGLADLGVSATSNQHASGGIDAAWFKPEDTITRDVAIVGGGSAGTYSAISLKDKGKSIVVIEKKGRIGGNTETYIDPATGIPIDIGVEIWHNIPIVKDYFKRLNVPLIVAGSDADPNATAAVEATYDLRTGKTVNVSRPAQADVSAAFAAFATFLQQYPRLNDGMFLPNPVPEDLVMPFGEFVKKHGFENALLTMFNYNPGLGDVLTGPTVEQIRVFGLSLLQSLSAGFLTTKRHNNSELYTSAEADIHSSPNTSTLLLSSEVVRSERTNSSVQLVVQTPHGKKLIKAKKLLIAFPPRLDFLHPFDLSKQERGVFGKFVDAGYYTSIVKNTGLPDNLSITNYVQNSEYNLPTLPGVYSIRATGVPGLKIAYYGTQLSNKTYPISDAAVKADIIASIKTLQKANPDKFNQTEPEFVVYSAHTPFYLQFKPEDTKTGEYDKLYALQGLRNTYWTGASFRAQDSSDVWRYSENEVLPKLLAGL